MIFHLKIFKVNMTGGSDFLIHDYTVLDFLLFVTVKKEFFVSSVRAYKYTVHNVKDYTVFKQKKKRDNKQISV